MQAIERIEIPRVRAAPGQRCGRLADRTRTETGAGSIRRGGIERDAEHGDIHVGEVFRVGPAQEAECAGVGRFGLGTVGRFAREREVGAGGEVGFVVGRD